MTEVKNTSMESHFLKNNSFSYSLMLARLNSPACTAENLAST